MFGITGAGLSSIKNYANGGKRARRSLDQWDRQSKKLGTEPHARDKSNGRASRVYECANQNGCSDESRPEAHGILTRTIGQSYSASRIRTQQPLESRTSHKPSFHPKTDAN